MQTQQYCAKLNFETFGNKLVIKIFCAKSICSIILVKPIIMIITNLTVEEFSRMRKRLSALR